MKALKLLITFVVMVCVVVGILFISNVISVPRNVSRQSEESSQPKEVSEEELGHFACNVCGPDMWFNTQRELDAHMKKIHSTPQETPSSQRYLCKRCNEWFDTEVELKNHRISEHIYGKNREER